MKKWLDNLRNKLPFFTPKTPQKPIDFLDIAADEHTAWWGNFSVEKQQSRYAKIGNIVLCIDHYNQEWRIASLREGQDKTQTKTMVANIIQEEIALKPVLPDRPVLFSLESPIFLPAKSTLSLYASTPVFIRIDMTPPTILDEIPCEVLSDTWFGKSTCYGELCYAAVNVASTRLDALLLDNIHAITPISVTNHTHDNILLKEAKVPSPHMALFCDLQNHLWTEQLNILFEDVESYNTVIIKGAPKGLPSLQPLSPSRIHAKNGFKILFNSK